MRKQKTELYTRFFVGWLTGIEPVLEAPQASVITISP